MVDALTAPFSFGIGQRALVEVVILGAVCGPLGVWVILYRQSYAAESLAHGMLPGLVLAAVAGFPLGVGGAIGLLVAATCISLAARDTALGADTAVAVVITALFGLGALLALAPSVPPRLAELLFGNVLGITGGALAASALLAAAVLAALAGLHRRLSLVAFDPQTAGGLGASATATTLALLVLLALTTLVAVQALGNLLVVALIIAPAAAALRLTPNLGRALAISTSLAVLAGIGGLYISYYLNVAAGAAIALVAVGLFALSLATRVGERRRGPTRPSPLEAVGAR